MRSRRGIIFTALCGLSLLSALAVAIVWFTSFQSESQVFSLMREGERYALRCTAGQFVLVGPPSEEVSDAMSPQIVSRMSNDDFDWSEIGSEYVCGSVRRDTATWQVYQRYFARERRGQGLEPAMRIWIAEAKDDPKRFVPAHMLFMFAAAQKRPIPYQKWREIGVRTDEDGARIPEVIMRADTQKKTPDFAARWDLRQEWSDVMETPRGAVFDGWILLGAMVMPLAWAARPRWRKRTLARWTLNWLSLASILVCAAAMAMWARSWCVDELFIFARRPEPKVGRFEIDSIRSMGSSKGKLISVETDTFHRRSGYGEPWGYRQQIARWPAKAQGTAVIGEKSFKLSGLEIYELPTQMVTPPTVKNTQPVAVGNVAGGWGAAGRADRGGR